MNIMISLWKPVLEPVICHISLAIFLNFRQVPSFSTSLLRVCHEVQQARVLMAAHWLPVASPEATSNAQMYENFA